MGGAVGKGVRRERAWFGGFAAEGRGRLVDWQQRARHVEKITQTRGTSVVSSTAVLCDTCLVSGNVSTCHASSLLMVALEGVTQLNGQVLGGPPWTRSRPLWPDRPIALATELVSFQLTLRNTDLLNSSLFLHYTEQGF